MAVQCTHSLVPDIGPGGGAPILNLTACAAQQDVLCSKNYAAGCIFLT